MGPDSTIRPAPFTAAARRFAGNASPDQAVRRMVESMHLDRDAPRERTDFTLTPQLIFGLVIAGLGLLFTLDNLELVEADKLTRYWPVLLILFGALRLAQARTGGGVLTGLLVLVAGIWLLLEVVVEFRVDATVIWPVLLMIAGGYLVWQGLSTRAASPPTREGNVTTISGMAILGSFTRRSSSQAFRGADLTAIMGACEIDLRDAAIHGEATIDVFTIWGGIDIRVPEDWTVESRVVPVMGGIEDKTRPPKHSEHRLIVRGLVVMGGVDIKN